MANHSPDRTSAMRELARANGQARGARWLGAVWNFALSPARAWREARPAR